MRSSGKQLRFTKSSVEEKPDNPGYQAELSVALSQLGNCLIQQGPENNEAAKQSLEKALAMQENLLTQQPENENIKEAIALTRERLESWKTGKAYKKLRLWKL